MFSLFACGFTDDRMKILIHVEKIGSAGKLKLSVDLRPINRSECRTKLAPAVGFEPTTNRLTADRSTTELRWNFFLRRCGA